MKRQYHDRWHKIPDVCGARPEKNSPERPKSRFGYRMYRLFHR